MLMYISEWDPEQIQGQILKGIRLGNPGGITEKIHIGISE